MGAINFRTTLVGKDLRRAYADAVEQAAWEHGHGGYTGTIAEKGSYVDLGPLPARMTVDRLEDLIFKLTDWRYRVEDHRSGYSKRKPGQNPVPEQWRSFVEKAADVYDDKWGPALVVELTGSAASKVKARYGRAGTRDKVWVAMGMASS